MKLFILILILNISIFAKNYLIGFSQDTLENDWRLAQIEDVQKSVDKYDNLTLIVKSAKGKVSKQIRDIESFINMGVDFIITSPINSKITSLVLKKAIDKGIKVILIDRGIDDNNYTTFIETDNFNIGKKAGEYLVKKLNFKGTILLLEGIKGSTATTLRTNGFMSVVSKHKNVKIIKREADYLRHKAIKVIEKIYSNNIKFDAIFSQSDSMLVGVREVLYRLGIDPSFIPSVGVDYIQYAQVAIKNGTQNISFLYPTCGDIGVESIVNIINNKTVKKKQILDSLIINKDNVDIIKPIF